ncbi:MAG TPA: hypothetical protein VE338_06725 [Ktedonobacterales bacterium]|jgi:hypothetical protein|nr:hypothetical protein [Ktedonobacterales bacterium]
MFDADDRTPATLVGAALVALLGGGLLIAVLLSVALAPFAPLFAIASSGGGGAGSGVCGGAGDPSASTALASALPNTSRMALDSAASPTASGRSWVSPASLSLRN